MTDGSDTCPAAPIGGASAQTDLNSPTAAETQAYAQVHMDQLTDLCQWGLSGSIITGVLMQFLKNHFSNAATIMMPSLQQYLYSAANNGVSSKLRIVNFTDYDASAGQNPAIVVKRGDFTSGRRIMGDRNQATVDEQNNGFSNYVRFISGSHSIFVTSTANGEIEDLGDEVFDSLTFMAPVFQDYLPFHNFEVVAKGGVGILDDLGNVLGIPITINYAYEYGWAIQPLAPRIKTFGIIVK